MHRFGFVADLLAVAAGGALGATARYLVSAAMQQMGDRVGLATLFVNVCGCFLIGVLAALTLTEFDVSPRLALLLKVGFLGALTTFSTFGLDAVALIQQDRLLAAALYVLGNVTLGIGAVWLALTLVRYFVA